MDQQELEKILSMMRLELSYQLRKYLNDTGLSSEEFSRQCEVPISVISLALDREPISFFQLERLCTEIHIFLDSLRRAPLSDPDYVNMRMQLWELAYSHQDFYNQAIALYSSLNSNYPFYAYERNIAWLCFEVEQEAAHSNSSNNKTPGVSPQIIAALYTPIRDESVRNDLARKFQQAREDLNGHQ